MTVRDTKSELNPSPLLAIRNEFHCIKTTFIISNVYQQKGVQTCDVRHPTFTGHTTSAKLRPMGLGSERYIFDHSLFFTISRTSTIPMKRKRRPMSLFTRDSRFWTYLFQGCVSSIVFLLEGG